MATKEFALIVIGMEVSDFHNQMQNAGWYVNPYMMGKSKYSYKRFDVYGTRFGEVERGRILLQDHGDRVSFRNIKIRRWK